MSKSLNGRKGRQLEAVLSSRFYGKARSAEAAIQGTSRILYQLTDTARGSRVLVGMSRRTLLLLLYMEETVPVPEHTLPMGMASTSGEAAVTVLTVYLVA